MIDFSLPEISELLYRMSNDWNKVYSSAPIPNKLFYNIKKQASSLSNERQQILNSFIGFKKYAFDANKIDQENERNPRENLQYYHKNSDIDEDATNKLKKISKLVPILDNIKKAYGSQPEYLTSYCKSLHETLNRTLKVTADNLDIFGPQINYLEQLLYVRYRLSMDDLSTMTDNELKYSILKKDENLIKKGMFLQLTEDDSTKQTKQILKDGNQSINDGIVNAIFGNNQFRRDGEKSVTRTITITINDTVLE